MRDYAGTVRALRAKAADPVVPAPEREALLAKAAEIEEKYNLKSRPTNETTVTSRDGRVYDYDVRSPYPPNMTAYWAAYMQDLARNQWQWNDKYYDRWGNAKGQNEGDTDDDYVEHAYAEQQEDEDYGIDPEEYDLYAE